EDATVIAQEPSNPLGQSFARTDPDGAFVFDALRPGTYQVISMGAVSEMDVGEDSSSMFAGMKFAVADVKDGEDTVVELGAPPEDPVRITGVVTAADEPVGGVMLTFVPDGGDRMEAMKFIQTKPDGSFETVLDQPGRYLVNVQRISGTGQQQTLELLETIPKAESHELELELPTAVIAGRVTKPNGDPAAGVRVTLNVSGALANGSFTGGQYAEISTEDDGTYRLDWLRPGTYAVGAGGPLLGGFFGDNGQETFGRQIRRGLEVEEGSELLGIDFRLEEPGKIVGRVVGPGGEAVAEAAIFVRNQDGELIDRISMVSADKNGRFEYTGLSEGTYEVTARTGDTVSQRAERVLVRPGEESEANLVLDTGTVLLVSLTDKAGEPIDCRVVVTGPDGQQLNGMFSYQDLMSMFSSGSFSTREQRVGPVAPGRYTVEAFTDDGRDARRTVTVTDQATRRVRLRLN
ncbi:MAG: carboxypeptidase-like regulatory domain-containing protein, partial [Planctomycetota bacterium]